MKNGTDVLAAPHGLLVALELFAAFGLRRSFHNKACHFVRIIVRFDD
jgi:hypothetical protein